MHVEIIVLLLMVAFFIGSYRFYRGKGHTAVYESNFAWKIDFFAILSGLYCIGVSYYFYTKEGLSVLLSILFAIGISQSMMHLAKWKVRAK